MGGIFWVLFVAVDKKCLARGCDYPLPAMSKIITKFDISAKAQTWTPSFGPYTVHPCTTTPAKNMPE